MLKLMPLLMLFSLASYAGADEKIGAWTIYDFAGGAIASTISDSGASFGVICLEATECSYFINPKLTCEKDQKMPLLASGEAGAMSLQGVCASLGDNTFIYVLDKNMDHMIAGSGEVGIAAPMADGKFKIVRFTMNGSIQTIAKIRARHRQPSDAAAPGQMMRDTVL